MNDLKERLGGRMQGAQPEPESTGTAVPSNETSIIPVNSGYVALKNNALEIISENLKHQPLSHGLFDTVKSPAGGATVFSVPGLTGEEAEKELIGIIINYTTPRAYWDTPDPVEGTPPICYSQDSIVSVEGKACTHCEFNTHGSRNGGETNAKACKESVCLYLLRPDNVIPLIVRVPVSSKMLFLKYTTRLVSNLTPISSVVTKITLEKATSKQGKPYALYNFELVDVLGPEEAATAKAFGQKFMELVTAADDVVVDEAV